MTFAERLQEIRTGFERPFWVANISEIFERLSYYAVFAALARYLHEALQFPTDQASSLSGLFGGAVWVMAIFGGALADRIGFRRALSLAYFILSCSYFLVGEIAAPWLGPVRSVLPLGVMVGIILFLPALGVALVKPSVVGTTARASKENVRSIGYSIYYTLVNIGSFMGPFLAGWIHSRMRVENVFRLAALSVFLMFIGVLIFFKEPRRIDEQQTTSIGQVVRNLLTVLGNGRFVLFLLIFSGYWIVFWQQYLILPIYIHDYVDANANTEIILIADPLVVITLTVAVNALTTQDFVVWSNYAGNADYRGGMACSRRARQRVELRLWPSSSWRWARSRSSRDTTSIFPGWLRPGNKVRTWASRFFRSGLDP